jgi:hypothetical protein
MEFLIGSRLRVLSSGLLVVLAGLCLSPRLTRTVAATEAVDAAPIVTLAVLNRTNATPSIAAEGTTVAVAWGASTEAGATDVFVATSRDGGRTFGQPMLVNDGAGDARLNGEQPPRIALHGGAVTVVWTAKGANGTKLLQSRSSDAGATFARAVAVPGSDGIGNRGWENAVVDANGRAYVVWLDHRELAQQDGMVAASHHDHAAMMREGAAAKPDGVAMAQRSKLYVASLDGAVAPRAITGGVCYCCKTALAAGSDGTLYTAWRHVYPGNIRDIAFSTSRDGARTFAAPLRVSEDKWVLEGCPDDGPSMAVDAKGRVHIAWPTLVNDAGADGPTIALFYATSADGVRFTPRARIPTEGMPHHPQIALASNGTVAIAWDESANGQRRAAVGQATMDGSGAARFTRTVVADKAVYPVVAATRDGTAIAWTSSVSGRSVIQVTRR